ncbi:MAG TPA: ElyC/SanA/YdcF family protein [Bacteroidia bacterium]|jgi:SanA protein|nr:ElyC/SanA/YdcF family protein [Bacteroidia bacterium]
MKRKKSIGHFLFSSYMKRWFLLYLPVYIIITIFICDHLVSSAGKGLLYTDATKIPAKKTALVFGTSPWSRGGNTNLFYQYRMEAVAALWNAGKIEHIIVSGDNSKEYYDESTAMKKSLMEMGVPDSVITLDYAGFRTLDSVVRCKWVFGQNDIIIVSQEFQNERALFIAKHFGINAVAFNAKDVTTGYGIRTSIREYFARVKAVLDVYVLNTQPHFPGPKEYLKI